MRTPIRVSLIRVELLGVEAGRKTSSRPSGFGFFGSRGFVLRLRDRLLRAVAAEHDHHLVKSGRVF